MTKSKPRQKRGSSEKQTIGTSGAEEQNQNHDPALISLFAESLGVVKAAVRPISRSESQSTTVDAAEASKSLSNRDGEGISLTTETFIDQVLTESLNTGDSRAFTVHNGTAKSLSRKRKRNLAEDDLENRYMSQLAEEEVKDNQNRSRTLRSKSQEVEIQRSLNGDKGSSPGEVESISDNHIVTDGEEESAMGDIPQHESLVTSREDLDLEKSSRTVFLANVSTTAIKSKEAKKTLMDHLASFTPSLSARKDRYGIESLRFRSVAFAASGIPKKAAFVKKEIMDTTTKSTNAYVVYATQLAAREAATRLNGSIVLDRHLRVDSVAHPAKIDHRRCVFVGNLGFVDDETNIKAAWEEEDNRRPRKARDSADLEEGLWRQFENAGIVESVRVVRDKTTRVGKGFAYVQFKDPNSVEKALLYHDKKFPPMLPRILRVTRARNTKSVAIRKERPLLRNAHSTKFRQRIPSQFQSSKGRAHRLLGRAGAAKLQATEGQQKASSISVSGVAKSPESMVFEGFRASGGQGKGTLKMAGRKRSKPTNRSKEFKAKGRKKPKA